MFEYDRKLSEINYHVPEHRPSISACVLLAWVVLVAQAIV